MDGKEVLRTIWIALLAAIYSSMAVVDPKLLIIKTTDFFLGFVSVVAIDNDS